MPEIFEYLNLVFSFYSNEHEPIPVHVKSSERETVFDLIIKERVLTEIKKRKRQGKKPLTNSEEKMKSKYYLKIVKAEQLSDYTVRLTFADHTVRDIDFGIFLLNHSHPQHNKYRNPVYFSKFKIKNGNIVWGKNADLSFHEEELYRGINPV